MLISDGINHGRLQSIIVGELKKAGLKHRMKKIILKNVKVSGIGASGVFNFFLVDITKTVISLILGSQNGVWGAFSESAILQCYLLW